MNRPIACLSATHHCWPGCKIRIGCFKITTNSLPILDDLWRFIGNTSKEMQEEVP